MKLSRDEREVCEGIPKVKTFASFAPVARHIL
jgi:hypothetical protein